MTDRHTYTGKELTTLLEQVRRELGSEATIVEANKVRSGGVAGFFATLFGTGFLPTGNDVWFPSPTCSKLKMTLFPSVFIDLYKGPEYTMSLP